MTTESEIIEGKLAEYLEQYPGLKELLTARCKACKLYGAETRRKDKADKKQREIDGRKNIQETSHPGKYAEDGATPGRQTGNKSHSWPWI